MAKKAKKSASKAKGPAELSGDVMGNLSDKAQTIRVKPGTTVAEAVRLAGHTVDLTKKASSPEIGWRLNGQSCDWTDKITTHPFALYKIPPTRAGR